MYVFVCHLGMRMFPDTCPHMMLAEARVHTDFTYTCEQQPVPVDGVSLPISELVQQWLRLREGEKYGVPKPAEKNTTIGHLLTSLQSNIQGVFFLRPRSDSRQSGQRKKYDINDKPLVQKF